MPATTVVMECDHTARWSDAHHAPKPGERIYCYACGDLREVLGRSTEWFIKCANCRYKRTYTTESGLSAGVRRHLRGFPAHRVIVKTIGTDEYVEISTGQDAQGLF